MKFVLKLSKIIPGHTHDKWYAGPGGDAIQWPWQERDSLEDGSEHPIRQKIFQSETMWKWKEL